MATDKDIYNVMIVEDDPMVALINEQYIKKNSLFRVAAKARNGMEAIKYLEENSDIDLVILDVYMAKMDGMEVLKKIRDEKFSVEVIMVTAANDSETIEDALHLGALDYLIKPFDFSRFQMALDKFIVQRKLFDQTKNFSQKNIDTFISRDNNDSPSKPTKKAELPKGILENTAEMILDCLRSAKGEWMNGEEISDAISLSTVTVRRYMSYLITSGQAEIKINYDTGGRPSNLYRIKTK